MPWIAAVAAIAGPIIGGALGKAFSSGDAEAAKKAQQAAMDIINGIPNPDAAALGYKPTAYTSAGTYNPELEKLMTLDKSKMEGVSTDPRLAAAQMQALDSLQKLGKGGLRPEDIAALNKIRNDTAQESNSRQQAILQHMQERGVGGSGAELAAQMGASQAAANRQSTEGLDVGALASQRALQALSQAGTLGGQIRTQEFGEKSDIAKAQDMVNYYNFINSQNVAGTNTGITNTAAQYNLNNAQDISNKNTAAQTEASKYGADAADRAYQNKVKKAQLASNAATGQATALNEQAAATQQMFGGAGQGVGTSAASMYNNSNKSKT